MNLDADRPLERLFLPYQRDWILSEARKRLVEKSVRIGFTFADAFRNVRKRLRHRRRDYLFTTKDEATALEYVRLCRRFADFYDFGGAVLRQGIEWLRVPRCDAAGRDTGFVDEVRAGCLKFDNGSRILAFSSNPNALRAFGGDVGIDEFRRRGSCGRRPLAGFAGATISACGRRTTGTTPSSTSSPRRPGPGRATGITTGASPSWTPWNRAWWSGSMP
jgi:phage FluMu gp28-like protein